MQQKSLWVYYVFTLCEQNIQTRLPLKVLKLFVLTFTTEKREKGRHKNSIRSRNLFSFRDVTVSICLLVSTCQLLRAFCNMRPTVLL
jgi:hypothetical protein